MTTIHIHFDNDGDATRQALAVVAVLLNQDYTVTVDLDEVADPLTSRFEREEAQIEAMVDQPKRAPAPPAGYRTIDARDTTATRAEREAIDLGLTARRRTIIDQVACPRCKVKPGTPCKTAGGGDPYGDRFVHSARYQAYNHVQAHDPANGFTS